MSKIFLITPPQPPTAEINENHSFYDDQTLPNMKSFHVNVGFSFRLCPLIICISIKSPSFCKILTWLCQVYRNMLYLPNYTYHWWYHFMSKRHWCQKGVAPPEEGPYITMYSMSPTVWHGRSGLTVGWLQNITLNGGQGCPAEPHPRCRRTETCPSSYWGMDNWPLWIYICIFFPSWSFPGTQQYPFNFYIQKIDPYGPVLPMGQQPQPFSQR